jgi:hypothetical protein
VCGRNKFVSCSAPSVPDISNELLSELNEETADEALVHLLTLHLRNLLQTAELKAVKAKTLRVSVLRSCVCCVVTLLHIQFRVKRKQCIKVEGAVMTGS